MLCVFVNLFFISLIFELMYFSYPGPYQDGCLSYKHHMVQLQLFLFVDLLQTRVTTCVVASYVLMYHCESTH